MNEFTFQLGDEDTLLNRQIISFPMLKQSNTVGIIGGHFLE